MIYLIGGTPRVGKSTVASYILERNNISCLSTDVVRNLLDYSPAQLGIKDLPQDKKLDAFFPYFLQLLKILQNKYPNFVIEGDLFSPQQVATIKEKVEVTCCFIGASHITLKELKYMDPALDWVSRLPELEQELLPRRFIDRSEYTKSEAEKYGFPYLDIYPDRQTALESAYKALMQ